MLVTEGTYDSDEASDGARTLARYTFRPAAYTVSLSI